MEETFTSNTEPLGDLMKQAARGQLQLPDFQRGWVWDDDHIRSLLASISLSYPIGAVMTLDVGNPDVRFKSRLIEGVSQNVAFEADRLLLDGQQRLTSLFLALKSRIPVRTRDRRGNELWQHYYADIRKCISDDEDREEGIISIPKDRRKRRDFGREVYLDLSTREKEIANEMFPLDIIFDGSSTRKWCLAYLNPRSENASTTDRFDRWDSFEERVIKPITNYRVPAIRLLASTAREAVCQVFEKVNTGGVTLTVFELLTATYAADNFELRDDWERRREQFKKNRLLKGLKRTEFLQIVTLLATYNRRSNHLDKYPEDERAPAVSCKRKDVLNLSLSDYKRWSEYAMKGLRQTALFLKNECIFAHQDLPYKTQLVPLGAIYGWLGEQGTSLEFQRMLRTWFWCGIFGELYGGTTETRFALDIQDCIAWVDDTTKEPRTTRDGQFQADRLLSLKTRNSAAYKGIFALLMKSQAQNFSTAEPIDSHGYWDDRLDIWHIFPRRWCTQNLSDPNIAKCVVNKTLVDARAARKMGSSPPKDYLRRIKKHLGGTNKTDKLNGILRSHEIDPVSVSQDAFEAFFNMRFERLIELIEQAMGKPVNRSKDRDDSPFVDIKSLEKRIQLLREEGESQSVEFKSTGRLNLHTTKRDPDIEWALIKTICAFMNSRGGGIILVGVADDGSVVGINHDYHLVKKRNKDGWGLWLKDAVSNSINHFAATGLSIQYRTFSGKVVACIEVTGAAQPTFAKRKGGDVREVFFARIGNSTQELVGTDLLNYRQERWPS